MGIADFQIAATVRHPCEKFISAFNYMLNYAGGNIRKNAEEMVGNRTIDEFVSYMAKNLRYYLNLAHFRPMYYYLVDKETDSFGVDIILCQEQWNEGIGRLMKRIGHE